MIEKKSGMASMEQLNSEIKVTFLTFKTARWRLSEDHHRLRRHVLLRPIQQDRRTQALALKELRDFSTRYSDGQRPFSLPNRHPGVVAKAIDRDVAKRPFTFSGTVKNSHHFCVRGVPARAPRGFELTEERRVHGEPLA